MICKHILKLTFLNNPELPLCPQLNYFKYCYITVKIYYPSFVCTQFVLFDLIDRTLSSATTLSESRPGSNGNEGVLPNLQGWSLANRWFNVIFRTLIEVGRYLTLCRDAVGAFYSPS